MFGSAFETDLLAYRVPHKQIRSFEVVGSALQKAANRVQQKQKTGILRSRFGVTSCERGSDLGVDERRFHLFLRFERRFLILKHRLLRFGHRLLRFGRLFLRLGVDW